MNEDQLAILGDQIQLISPVYPKEFIQSLRSKALNILEDLRKDYFASSSDDEFLGSYLGHTSMISRSWAYRLLDQEVFNDLKKYALQALSKQGIVEDTRDFFLYPIFYLRMSNPKYVMREEMKRSLLDSQPHYDQSFGLSAIQLWIPLEDVDEDTGGLCGFDKSAEQIFPVVGGKIRYDTSGYLDNYRELDSKIKDKIKTFRVSQGDMLIFGTHALHGATRPRSKQRFSVDFRLIPKQNFENASKRFMKVLNFFNKNLNLSNALNLLVLGDYKGAIPRLKSMEGDIPITPAELATLMQRMTGKDRITPLTKTSHWSVDSAWIE